MRNPAKGMQMWERRIEALDVLIGEDMPCHLAGGEPPLTRQSGLCDST
jgi:hypothetical protein